MFLLSDFLKYVENIENTELCWNWKGDKFWNGYGRYYDPITKLQYRAHRISYCLYFSTFNIGSKGLITHKCNNKICVNPYHLILGNHSSNTIDMVKSGTHNMARATKCPKGHEYNKENTYINPKGSRICKICKRVKNEEYKCRIAIEKSKYSRGNK